MGGGRISDSSIPTPLVSFGLSNFSIVFCQGATMPQLRQLPPYSLVHFRRTVWYIAKV